MATIGKPLPSSSSIGTTLGGSIPTPIQAAASADLLKKSGDGLGVLEQYTAQNQLNTFQNNNVVPTPQAPVASVPVPDNNPAPVVSKVKVPLTQKKVDPTSPPASVVPPAPITPMIDVYDKNGNKTSVSQKDFDTNPFYKNEGYSTIPPSATTPSATIKTEQLTEKNNKTKITDVLNQGYDSVANIATAAGLSSDEVNNLINNDESLSNRMAINANSNQQDQAYKDYNAKIDSITNGTFALTPSEQADIKSIQDNFDRLRAAQLEANKNYEGAVTTGEIRSGRQEFMNQISSGIYKQALNDGVQKISDIESKAAAAIRSYKDAVEAKNYKAAENSYNATQKYLSDKSDTIKELHTLTMDEYKRQQDVIANNLNNIKIQQEISKNYYTSLAPALIDAKPETIQLLAEQYGIDPVGLAAEVEKQKKESIKEAISQSGNIADILSKSQNGGEIDIPGYGKVNIKPGMLTPKDVLDILSKSGDTNVMTNYLKTLGINIPGTGEGSAVIIPQSSRLAYVNNNPGNLRYVGQPGASQGEGGFAKFDTPEAGYAALKAQIELDASRGLTLSQFVNKYAPPSENDTNLYISQIANATSTSSNTPISQIDTEILAQAMAKKESGTSISATSQKYIPQEIKTWISEYKPEAQKVFNSASEQDQANLYSVMNGRALLSDITSGMKGNIDRQRLMALATKIDPTFSENKNKSRYNFIKQWDSPQGKQFITRTAINTALGHLAQLKKDIDALDNTQIKPGKPLTKSYNTIANMLKKESGRPEVTNFNLTLTALAGELASAYKGGTAPTDQETQEFRDSISQNFSPSQLNGIVNQASKLLSSKITSAAQEYQNVMDKFPDDPIVQEYVLNELRNSGVDTSAIDTVLSKQLNNPIRVKLKETGQTGTISAGEFDPNLYEKIN